MESFGFGNKFEAQRSGFKFERRGNGAIRSFRPKAKPVDGNEVSGVCPDEVKLIRAQGECLGIRSR